MRESVRALRETAPERCRQFHQKVIVERDIDYFNDFMRQLHAAAEVP